ncbi:MAG: hypothetical protein JW797_00880 [Bradymonadales bacterium]|nr:hypothetical protein [Bradymonadales bacterium]
MRTTSCGSSSPVAQALVVVCLCLVWISGCQTTVQHGLSEPEANEILVLLEQHGIAGDKARDGRSDHWAVRVPASDASRSWQIMQANGLPRRSVGGFEQTFADSGLIPTAMEDRIRLQQAVAGELERSLMAMDAILDARVHLVVPANNTLRRPDQPPLPPRASVLVVFQQNPADPEGVNTTAVQRLVAGAVEGLDPSNVVVVTTPRAVSVVPPGEGLVNLGPWTVSTASKVPLQLLVVIPILLNLMLGAALAFLVIRRRRLRAPRT